MTVTITQVLATSFCTKPRIFWVSISFFAATLGVFASGIPCTIPLYVGFMKSFFNSTHFEVSYITSAYAIGEGFHLPAALFESKFGFRWTMFVAVVVTCSGLILLYLSFILSILRNISFLLIGLFFFMMSNGRTFTYMSSFACAVCNTPKQHRAKAVGFLNIIYEFAVLMQILFFYNVFGGDEQQADNMARFTLFSFGLVAAFHLVTGPFLVKEQLVIETTDKKEESAVATSASAIRLQHLNKTSAFRFFLSPEFLLLTFSMSLPIALCNTLNYNTVHFTDSLNLKAFDQTFLNVFKAGVIIFRVAASVGLDCCRGSKSGLFYSVIIGIYVQAILGQLSALLSLELNGTSSVACLAFAFLTAGTCLGAMYIFLPLLVADICGLPNFARNVALVYSVGTVSNLLNQFLYSHLYDSAKKTRVGFLNETYMDNNTTWPWNNQFDINHVSSARNETSSMNSVNWSIGINTTELNITETDITSDSASIEAYCRGPQCVRPLLITTTCLLVFSLALFVTLVLRLNDKCVFRKGERSPKSSTNKTKETSA